MKWTLKLERIDEAGILQSTVVGLIERPELTSEADLGLAHDDGKYLIRQVQAEIAHDQVRALISRTRPCPSCGRLRPIKEHRRRRIDTIFWPFAHSRPTVQILRLWRSQLPLYFHIVRHPSYGICRSS